MYHPLHDIADEPLAHPQIIAHHDTNAELSIFNCENTPSLAINDVFRKALHRIRQRQLGGTFGSSNERPIERPNLAGELPLISLRCGKIC